MHRAFAPKGSVNLFELGAIVAAVQQIDTRQISEQQVGRTAATKKPPKGGSKSDSKQSGESPD
jgi:hypothetical protein